MEPPDRERDEPALFYLNPYHDRPGGPSPRGELPGFMLLMLATAAAGFLVVAIVIGLGVAHTLDVRARDSEAEAQVIDRRSRMHTNSKGRVSGYSYYVRHSFEHPGGRVEAESEVSRDEHDTAVAGSTLRVRYEAADPDNVGAASESPAYAPPWGLFFWLAFSAGATVWYWKTVRDDAWYYLRGRLVRGRLLALDAAPDERGGTWVHARYSFLSPTSGATLEAESRLLRSDWAAATASRTPGPGDEVFVRHAGDERYELL